VRGQPVAKGRVCLLPLARAPTVLTESGSAGSVSAAAESTLGSPGPTGWCARAKQAGHSMLGARSVLIPAGDVMESTADQAGRPMRGCSTDGSDMDVLDVGEALQRMAAAVQHGRFEEVGTTCAVDFKTVCSPQLA